LGCPSLKESDLRPEQTNEDRPRGCLRLFHACFDVPGVEDEHRRATEFIEVLVEEFCQQPLEFKAESGRLTSRRRPRLGTGWAAHVWVVLEDPWLSGLPVVLAVCAIGGVVYVIVHCGGDCIPSAEGAEAALRRRRHVLKQLRGGDRRVSAKSIASRGGPYRPSPLRKAVALPDRSGLPDPSGSPTLRRRALYPLGDEGDDEGNDRSAFQNDGDEAAFSPHVAITIHSDSTL
jgi:hypothetical protein